jgi:putative membrane-bound dehydrogenase-like protein
MLRRSSAVFLFLSAILHGVVIFAQHSNSLPAFGAAESDSRRFSLASGLKLDVWAAEPQLSNSVAFAFDGKGRVYLAESDRWAISVFDITQHTNWLWPDMSFRSVADRGAFLTNQFVTNLAFLTQDSEVVRRVEDRDGDGKADHTGILATGFTNAVDGTAAGVLATREGIYFANIPSLWKLDAGGAALPRSPDQNGPHGNAAPPRSPLATGFGVHIGVSGHDLHGLIKGPDGRIYMSFGDRGCVLTNREGVVINLPDTGGVLRCETDGRDLEVFCYGLRNPQELAFDDFGNLWTVDNDTAGADPCRVLHLVEGGDYGWRTSYQHMDGFGPWVQEELWKGGQDGILPPAGTVSQGPSGLAFYPGTGFGERLAGTFLHCDFPGGVWAYTVKPQGASYVVDRKEKFLWNCWPTDVDFGPDGAAYVLDWVSGWGQTPRGRIYRITPVDVAAEVTRRTGSNTTGESASSPQRLREPELIAQVKQLLAEGMTQRGEKGLLDLLGHADRRVRLEAQWELAGRGTNSFTGLLTTAKQSKVQFARIHSLWAIGQIARPLKHGYTFGAELCELLPLLEDRNDEVRAQTALVLGDGRLSNALRKTSDLLKDPNPWVRRAAMASIARHFVDGRMRLHFTKTEEFTLKAAQKVDRALKLSSSLEIKAAENMVDAWRFDPFAELPGLLGQFDQIEPFIENAVIRFLSTSLDSSGSDERAELLETFAAHSKVDVRRLTVGALRRLADPTLTNFLSDSDPRLIVAAGRAIHDVPIVEGFPALAAFVTKIDCPTHLMSRVINACYRLGTQQHAQMLAGFAAREDVPDWARVLALRALADWEKPSPLDRVNGLWRPLVIRKTHENGQTGRQENEDAPSSRFPAFLSSTISQTNVAQSSATAAVDATAVQPTSPSPGGEGRGEGGPSSRSAIPSNPLLERAAAAQAARNLGRAAEIPVLPADLGRSVSYDEAMALRRNPAPAQRAFLRVAGDLMNPFNLNEAGQPAGTREVLPLQIAVAEAAAKLRVKEAGTPLFEKFARTNTAPELRRAILPALVELRSPLTSDAVKLALADPDAKLRATALPYLDRLEGAEDTVAILSRLIPGMPGGGAPQSAAGLQLAVSHPAPDSAGSKPAALSSDGLPLVQAALAALAKLPGAKADEAIRGALATLEAQQLPTELALDVQEAARTRGLAAQRATIPAALPELLVGGNAERGRQVFFHNQTVQCLRCHKVGSDGGIVGPDLTGIGKRQTRDYLLESILQPNAKIAAGFENVVLTLNDGSTVAGALKAEGDAELSVEITGDDGTPGLTQVAKSRIRQRERGPSAMPEGLGDQLTPFELRDLVEYLATLK